MAETKIRDYQDFDTLEIRIEGQVAAIIKHSAGGAKADPHWELANAFSRLREDNSIRVIILTGEGDKFVTMPEKSFYLTEPQKKRTVDPSGAWRTFTGIIRCHEAMAQIEKPIVARVNGNAIGFGSSIAFASDLIVAREDVIFADTHLGMGEMEGTGPDFGFMPGDGGLAWLPLYMTPARAKEYLLLAKQYRARELADLGIINYAVPAEKLDSVVDDIVQRLLKRSAYALAWAKRVANRRAIEHLNMTLDAGAAYEMVNFLQLDRSKGEDKKTLD